MMLNHVKQLHEMSRKAGGKDSVGKDFWGGKKSQTLRLGIAKTIDSRLCGKQT